MAAVLALSTGCGRMREQELRVDALEPMPQTAEASWQERLPGTVPRDARGPDDPWMAVRAPHAVDVAGNVAEVEDGRAAKDGQRPLDGGPDVDLDVASQTDVAQGRPEVVSLRAEPPPSYARGFPMPVDRALLDRGEERYTIYCAPCHDTLGTGNGVIVQRGFPSPPSFHERRLVDAPEGYYVDVIANGFGQMYSYAQRVPPRDRWAVVAWIRVLQLSRRTPVALLDPSEQARLRGAP